MANGGRGRRLGFICYDFDIMVAALKSVFAAMVKRLSTITSLPPAPDSIPPAGGRKRPSPASAPGSQEKGACFVRQRALCLGRWRQAVNSGRLHDAIQLHPGIHADKGRQYGVVTIHVEDEISAMNMA
jgi:hypothetical protein